MADPFTRPTESIDQALTIQASRRTLAMQELNRATAEVEQAERALLLAEQNKLMRERHVGLCDRSIEGLLDERLRSVGQQTAAV